MRGIHKIGAVLATLLAFLKLVYWITGGHHVDANHTSFVADPPKPLTAEEQQKKDEQDKNFAEFMKTVRELEKK